MENVTIVMIRGIGLEIVQRLRNQESNRCLQIRRSLHMDNVLSVDLQIIGLLREEDFTSQQSSISTEKQQTESSVYTAKPSRKRKAPEPDISDISPKRRRLDTRSKKTAIRTKTGKKPYCFICKSDSHTPRSCTEMVAENWDKPISSDEPDSDSIVHIH